MMMMVWSLGPVEGSDGEEGDWLVQDVNVANMGRNNNIQVVIGLPEAGIGGDVNVKPGSAEELPGPSSRPDEREAPVQMQED